MIMNFMLNNKILLKVSKTCCVYFLSANQTLHITNSIKVKFILFCPVHKHIK